MCVWRCVAFCAAGNDHDHCCCRWRCFIEVLRLLLKSLLSWQRRKPSRHHLLFGRRTNKTRVNREKMNNTKGLNPISPPLPPFLPPPTSPAPNCYHFFGVVYNGWRPLAPSQCSASPAGRAEMFDRLKADERAAKDGPLKKRKWIRKEVTHSGEQFASPEGGLGRIDRSTPRRVRNTLSSLWQNFRGGGYHSH